MSEPVNNNPTTTWWDRNGYDVAKYSAILGIAIFFFAMGMMAAASANSHQIFDRWDFSKVDSDYTLANARFLPTGMAIVCGEGGGAVGLMIAIPSLVGVYCLSKKEHSKKVEQITREEASTLASQTRWQNLGKLIGFVSLIFGVGMILSSALIFEHSIKVLKEFSETPLPSDPWTMASDKYLLLASLKQQVAEYIPDGEKMMAGMATVGTFMTIGGGALIFAMGGFATLRRLYDHFRKKETENPTLDAPSDL